MKKVSMTKIISFIVSLVPIILYLFMQSNIADSIPVHFDLTGKADSFAGKTSTEPYMIVSTSLIMFIAYTVLSHFLLLSIRKNSKENSGIVNQIFDYILIILTLSVSCLLIYYIFLIKNIDMLNIKVPLIIVTLTLGLIFVVIGNSLPKLTQNKYAGFRTKEDRKSVV